MLIIYIQYGRTVLQYFLILVVVVITMMDGHKSNEKIFKKILRGKEFLFIEHPYFPGHKIFIAYDPTPLQKFLQQLHDIQRLFVSKFPRYRRIWNNRRYFKLTLDIPRINHQCVESLQQTWISGIPGNCKLSSNNM